MQQLLAGLREHHLFAQPVQKATADIALERFHGVADAGLSEVELARGEVEPLALAIGDRVTVELQRMTTENVSVQ